MQEKYKIFIGIDPGSTGAVASIYDGKASVHKMPETAKEIQMLLNGLIPIHGKQKIVCEKVHSSPQMGVSTAFKFGQNFGRLEGILAFADVEYIGPMLWQSALNCRTGGDKSITMRKAKELFPDTKGITLKTADALLLAYYGYLKYGR